MVNNWLTFWKEKNAFDDSMVINYAYFLQKVEKYIKPAPTARVLDIGSGPGNLEDAWYNRVAEIHGLDISERYNIIAREKHKEHSNVFFYDLPENDYLNFSMLNGKKFDIIIVMSVLQYYRNKEEVVQLLENIKKLSAPGAQVLLCDLMVKNSFLKEIVQVLSEAIKEGKFFSTLSLFFRLRFSSYYKVKKEAGFLVLTQEEWRDIIEKLKLNATFIEEPLTLQKSRQNLLIRF
jgi:2-polyprenyl-3-methyl-5-hydroxy-6-metoxy-1,4-benzoquinol methylase